MIEEPKAIPAPPLQDYMGRVPILLPVQSNQYFPLVTEYGYGMTRDWKIVEHRFGYPATMGIQRYSMGSGARKFQFVKTALNYADKRALNDFYDSVVQGSYQSFIYSTPDPDRQKFYDHEVVFDVPPISVTDLSNRAQTGLTFLEIISQYNAPIYTISNTYTRFPSDALSNALADQIQTIIPLIHIRVRNTAVPDIYLSDRRVRVNGFPGTNSMITFLPRLLNVGVPGMSDVLMSQSIDGRADNVSFRFGNADKAMTQLINDCSIEYAQVDLNLFHVQTNNLLQMWRGIVISWQVDGSPEMTIQCADGIYPITQVYPPRTVSRQCWKPFNTDVVPGYRPCPWSTTTGHKGNPNTCDYNFNSPNGCLSHGMDNYFGGHFAESQNVVINDKGSQAGGASITSSSLISDSIWGKPLPEIWCNYFGSSQRAFWTECLVVAVRDESTFMDVLGIVGVGPIGGFEGMGVTTNSDGYKFIVAPQADGFYPQGLKYDSNLVITQNNQLGLRQSVGYDPAHRGTSITDGIDSFCLGQGSGTQYWAIYDPNFSNLPGWPNTVMPYAAGTALTELRYAKSAGTGLTPTPAESHSMQVPIRYGLTGATFDSNDVRTLVTGLTNPFWIAANVYFRALGIQQSDAATQLNYIVRDSLTNAQSTGCADIANIWTTPLIGSVTAGYVVTPAGQAFTGYNLDIYNQTFSYATGTQGQTTTISITSAVQKGYVQLVSNPNEEPQFMFQGSMTESKPLRDWLTEILNCCLGYYCFEFGKLNLGIRSTAVPTDGFNLASMLYQSLTLAPIQATFEYLKITFANVELQYQNDLAEYCDKDHAVYYNRAATPLTSSMKSVGISTLSQGLRVAVSRTREEIGGILRPDLSNPYIEWDNNKRATFKTTLLALSTEIGQVVQIQHPDITTYPGAAPNSRPGSNPALPTNAWPFRIKKWLLHSDWSVTIVADSCVDSMYDLNVGPQPPTGMGTRPMAPLFFPEPLGQWAPHQIQAAANDALYPNEWTFALSQTFSYQGDGTLLTSAILSGALPVNRFIPSCGAPDMKKGQLNWTAAGGSIPSGTTMYMQLCASIIDANGHTQYSPPSQIVVFQVPADAQLYSMTINQIFWPPVTGLTGWALFAGTTEDLICLQATGTGQPASITFAGPLPRQTYSVPDYDLRILRLQATHMIHGGVLGARISAVDTTSITSNDTIDTTGVDNWTGRVISIIGRQLTTGAAPYAHFKVTAWNAATGQYTLDRNPVAAGIEVDDVFVINTLGYDNSGTANVIGDPGMINASYPTGDNPHDPTRIGQMLRIIAGTGRGLSAKIIDNDATSYTLDRNLIIDATSVWIVTDPGWIYSKDVIVDNADPNKTTQSSIPINNYLDIQLLVEGVTIDMEGDIIDDTNALVRMLFIPGVQGTTNITSNPALAGRRKTILARAIP
jgi:hypothetical protein